MPYDEALADRVRTRLARHAGLEERRMFGGLAFLLNGHMCCGVLDDRLVLRLGDDGAREALAHEHASPMDFTGRPLRSMVYVGAPGIAADADLERWLDGAVRFTAALPPKTRAG